MIRKMETEEELRGKAYVHWRSWHEAYPGLVRPEYLDALTLEKCEDMARKWRDNILVAKDGERVVGFVGYGEERKSTPISDPGGAAERSSPVKTESVKEAGLASSAGGAAEASGSLKTESATKASGPAGEVPKTGEIFALYVLSEYYGTGTARELMDAALEKLGEYPRIRLWVLKENPRAIRFYEKCGFRADGAETFSSTVGAAEIRMTLTRRLRNADPESGETAVFSSERIHFVPVSERLIPDYLTMVNDIEHVERFLGGQHEPYTAGQEAEWVRSKREEKAQVFSMLEKASGVFIGNIELMDVHDGQGELGIALTAAKQDRGFGTEAILALIQYARERLGLIRVHLRTQADNARAIHVYEKCGFREFARTERHLCMQRDTHRQKEL